MSLNCLREKGDTFPPSVQQKLQHEQIEYQMSSVTFKSHTETRDINVFSKNSLQKASHVAYSMFLLWHHGITAPLPFDTV